jgi:hypothetical protein
VRTISKFTRLALGAQCQDQDFLVLAGEVAVSIGSIRVRLKPGELLAGHYRVSHEHDEAAEEAVLLEMDAPSGIEDYFNSLGESLLKEGNGNLPIPAHSLAKMIMVSQSAAPPAAVESHQAISLSKRI